MSTRETTLIMSFKETIDNHTSVYLEDFFTYIDIYELITLVVEYGNLYNSERFNEMVFGLLDDRVEPEDNVTVDLVALGFYLDSLKESAEAAIREVFPVAYKEAEVLYSWDSTFLIKFIL